MTEVSSPAVFALTKKGAVLGKTIQEAFPGASLYLPERLAGSFAGANIFKKLSDALAGSFIKGEPLVCIMAAGIVVRTLAPHIGSKDKDPAVVVVDDGGKFAISLLSGHLGGANRLAKRVAEITEGQAVITTATDAAGFMGFDVLADDAGLVIENLDRVKTLNLALLEGEPIGIFDPRAWLGIEPYDIPGIKMLATPTEARDTGVNSWVYVGERVMEFEPPRCLVLRPRTLVVGVGCNRNTPFEEIVGAIERVFAEERLSLFSVYRLATVDLKRNEKGILKAASHFGWDASFYTVEELRGGPGAVTPSQAVESHIGVDSVCEKAAMLVAGSTRLAVKKKVTGNVTVAVAWENYL